MLPYANNPGLFISPHYAKAYYGQTAESSTSSSTATASSLPPQHPGPWYQPGKSRCNYKQCAFVGSVDSVKLHQMDRHLIYPPEYKKMSDWDADPSLKGKKVPIMGTSIVLDTEEALAVWIADRKKRWPSTARVEDLTLKLAQARARGQTLFEDTVSLGKRARQEQSDRSHTPRQKRPVFEPPTKALDNGWGSRAKTNQKIQRSPSPSDDGSASDSAPESFAIQKTSDANPPVNEQSLNPDELPSISRLPKHRQLKRNEPRRLPHNQFASRPTLLRNLLLPEVRITVSNVSQAIRFLVDNDFLDHVEIQAGQASEPARIQVLDSVDHPPTL